MDVDIFKKRLKVMVPLAHIGSGVGPNGFRAPSIDVAELEPFDLVVD
jgi:hypothetical protein